MGRRRFRGLLAAVLGGVLLSGCVVTVGGAPRSADTPPPDAPDGEVTVVGTDGGPVDRIATNALADLGTFWAEQLPDVFGVPFEPPAGGFFSVDPDDVDPSVYPDGVGCGSDPRDVEGNAFYCRAEGVAHSDAISWDRAFLADLADGSGRFLPALVMAHEYGHALQARVGYPRTSIATETQADCLAGAWTAWVAAGEAAHSQIREAELDEVLGGYLQLRDPVGTGAGQEEAHGSFFDRVSAFQEGFDAGPEACRDGFGPGRPFTQSEFTSDLDLARGGDAPYPTVEQLVAASLPEFWTRAFDEVLGGRFDPPDLEPFSGSPPGCAPDDELDLVACPDEGLVGYDERDLALPLYEEIGDFAVLTAVSVPYALAARGQLGLPVDGEDAARSAICLTGWYAAAVADGALTDIVISPGDVDESVQFLLTRAGDPAVLPDVDLSGFELVDLFRAGFLEGAAACDVGA
ncbi:neutral zinc metallopeptidase [Trujillonella endophytica]|uniref:Predicted metalloprotease n=1 Tax=Trujillonella endophytica TaxID=673521 RepID=A0A1H8TJE3_9ACTN|nr:neutral zinc metallopeptidase [Trujillella endophytica]SEO90931.1 Predicted metalloprotease [Trujillella endophytica]